MRGQQSTSAFVCDAGCGTYDDECPFCIMERLSDSAETAPSSADSEALHAAFVAKSAEGAFDPALRERPGSIGITLQGATRQRRKAQWLAQFWNTRLGFPMPVNVGAYATQEAAAEAYDVACIAMGLPAKNYPDRVHTPEIIEAARVHLEAKRKPV